MELVTFLILFAASVTVGLAAARGFFYLIFRFLCGIWPAPSRRLSQEIWCPETRPPPTYPKRQARDKSDTGAGDRQCAIAGTCSHLILPVTISLRPIVRAGF